MLIFGTCAIVDFALYRGKNKLLIKNINCLKKDKDEDKHHMIKVDYKTEK